MWSVHTDDSVLIVCIVASSLKFSVFWVGCSKKWRPAFFELHIFAALADEARFAFVALQWHTTLASQHACVISAVLRHSAFTKLAFSPLAVNEAFKRSHHLPKMPFRVGTHVVPMSSLALPPPPGWHTIFEPLRMTCFEWRCPLGEKCGMLNRVVFTSTTVEAARDAGRWHLYDPNQHSNPKLSW